MSCAAVPLVDWLHVHSSTDLTLHGPRTVTLWAPQYNSTETVGRRGKFYQTTDEAHVRATLNGSAIIHFVNPTKIQS